jgi:hypothetical protein
MSGSQPPARSIGWRFPPPTTKEIAQGHLIGAIGLSLGIALFILILYATLR